MKNNPLHQTLQTEGLRGNYELENLLQYDSRRFLLAKQFFSMNEAI